MHIIRSCNLVLEVTWIFTWIFCVVYVINLMESSWSITTLLSYKQNHIKHDSRLMLHAFPFNVHL